MEITLAELKELIGASQSRISQPVSLSGHHIVVLDRGFVYVGKVSLEGDFLRMTGAKNIRVWGTTKGLGELTEGPTANTKLDDVGELVAPMRAVIHIIQCKLGW